MLSPLFHPREHAVQKILPGVSDHADGELSMTGVITAMMTLGDSFAKRAQTQPLLLRAGDLDRCDEQGSKENERGPSADRDLPRRIESRRRIGGFLGEEVCHLAGLDVAKTLASEPLDGGVAGPQLHDFR